MLAVKVCFFRPLSYLNMDESCLQVLRCNGNKPQASPSPNPIQATPARAKARTRARTKARTRARNQLRRTLLAAMMDLGILEVMMMMNPRRETMLETMLLKWMRAATAMTVMTATTATSKVTVREIMTRKLKRSRMRKRIRQRTRARATMKITRAEWTRMLTDSFLLVDYC